MDYYGFKTDNLGEEGSQDKLEMVSKDELDMVSRNEGREDPKSKLKKVFKTANLGQDSFKDKLEDKFCAKKAPKID